MSGSKEEVSLVIPGKNCAWTLGPCLEAVVPMVGKTPLREILFVDDGSTDGTSEIARRFPIRLIGESGRGRGAARNRGWREAKSPLVWFVDSDCVAEPDALVRLLPHMDDPKVVGVGGSYGNMEDRSLLACLIHEEIVERHRRMPARVNFLATFNVMYRRAVLEELNGFDERFLRGQDAEFSWRVREAGYELAFDAASRVKHFHPISWRVYLTAQREQGYWRAHLHRTRKGHSMGDSYSGLLDHVQPPLAMLCVLGLVMIAIPRGAWAAAIAPALLLFAQWPMTGRIVARTMQARFLLFGFMGFVRAFARGLGLTTGAFSLIRNRR